MVEDDENRAWVDDMVERQRRAGSDFTSFGDVYRRMDGLAHAYFDGLITRWQMQAGRRYERDYDALHRSGKYRCTFWRFVSDNGLGEGEEDRSLQAALDLRRARGVLTRRQRVVCDAVCGEDILMSDADLPAALDALFDHYGVEEYGIERTEGRVYRPPHLSDEEKRAERIRNAFVRLEKLRLEEGATVAPGLLWKLPQGLADPEPEPDLSWEDFLPTKPIRSDRAMNQAWLTAQGVVRKSRDSRSLGSQERETNKRKARAKGVIRKRVRRKGNS